jgi:hypothetical protein
MGRETNCASRSEQIIVCYVPRDTLRGRESLGLIDESHDASAADLRHGAESVNDSDSPVVFSQPFAIHSVEARLNRLAAQRAPLAPGGVLRRREKKSSVICQESLAGLTKPIAVEKNLVGKLHVAPNREYSIPIPR